MKTRHLILLAALACALGACHHPSTNTDQGHDLKFISLNIRLGSEWSRTQDGDNYWDYRKEAVVDMVRREAPDALGLQEVLPGQLAYLDSALSDYERIGVGREDGKSQGEHMAIFVKRSRIEIARWHTYWLNATGDTAAMGWDAGCPRTVTAALLNDRQTGRQMVYLNTHLDHVGLQARAESTKLIARLAIQWGADSLPLLVGGDMNTQEDDTIFSAFYDAGLANCRTAAPVSDTLLTYTGFGHDTPKRIDHFFSRGLTLKTFRTLNGNYGVPYISDHYPIEITFAY